MDGTNLVLKPHDNNKIEKPSYVQEGPLFVITKIAPSLGTIGIIEL